MGWLFGLNPDSCGECAFCNEVLTDGFKTYTCSAKGQSESKWDQLKEVTVLHMATMSEHNIDQKKWEKCPLTASIIENIMRK